MGPSSFISGDETFMSLGSPESTDLRSAPAQNVPPAPVKTATEAVGSASNARNASAKARAVGWFTQFFKAALRERRNEVREDKVEEPTRSGSRQGQGSGAKANQTSTLRALELSLTHRLIVITVIGPSFSTRTRSDDIPCYGSKRVLKFQSVSLPDFASPGERCAYLKVL
jgi:hypothetical protein